MARDFFSPKNAVFQALPQFLRILQHLPSLTLNLGSKFVREFLRKHLFFKSQTVTARVTMALKTLYHT